MNEPNDTSKEKPVKPCVKCGSTNRRKRGDCVECHKTRQRAYYYANKERILKEAAAHRHENREHLLVMNRVWQKSFHEKNPEKRAEYSARYRAKNTQKESLRSAKYYEKNKEKILERQKDYRASNPDAVSETQRKHYQKNKDKYVVKFHKRRAKILSNGGSLSENIVSVLMERQGGRCACCGKPLVRYHLDHIMPIALGGANTDDNVQLLLPKCNLRKGAKHPVDYMRSQGKMHGG